MMTFFADPGFDFEVRTLLGNVHYGCGDIGEVLATVALIADGDDASWVGQWRAVADRVAAIAGEAAAAGHLVSARGAYLRAAAYYAAALASVDGTDDPEAALRETFTAHRRCFDAHVALLDPAAERVAIGYGGATMPGYFFAFGRGGARPTLILSNGSDGPVTALWPGLGAPALARGYNVLIFDGPGQQSMLFERGVPFRPDWEEVITPVVDFLLQRPEVDRARIALYGMSQAGYWVPRALVFEHRIAAAIADPGVVDVSESWMRELPEDMLRLLEAGDQRAFDEAMAAGMRMISPKERQRITWRSKPYGKKSPYELFTAVREYQLGDLTAKIGTPLLITDPQDEQFWPGQSQRLYDALPGRKDIAGFTRAEGAAGHCEPMARSLLEQRMFDWLDDTLGL